MRKSSLLLPLIAIVLSACVKTSELYPNDAYCHTEFDLNYYLEWNKVDELNINETREAIAKPSSQSGLSEDMVKYGEENKLVSNNNSFAYGYLSKLYDGRISCGGLYQKSRVQLNKTGYATFFPKQLKEATSFSMALRGGTTCETPLKSYLNVDFELSFYIHITNSDSYDKVIYHLNDVSTITDYGGDTCVYTIPLTESIRDAVAMSLTYKLKDTSVVTDDYLDEEKEHFAIMLYEILLPGSTWL